MKKAILILIFIVSANFIYGQTKPVVDTTKKQPMYFIAGTAADFQLLFKAIQQPMDVTPNQIAALAAWINKLQMIPEKEKK
jgi:hypothetical protein